jgi:hypothetical protein
MSFKKFQKVEKVSVKATDQTKVESYLKRIGKSSALDLSDKERKELSKSLNQ